MIRAGVFRLVAAALVGLCAPAAALAQASPRPAGAPAGPGTRAFDLSIGGRFTTGATFGTTNTVETRPDGTPFVLFSSANSQNAGVGADVRLDRRFGRRLSLGASGSIARAVFTSRISGDAEGAADTTATDAALTFAVQGSAEWRVARVGRVEPFVRGEGGWLRQLSGDRHLFGDGWIATIGGGVKYWWRDRPRAVPLGLEIAAGAVARSGGLLVGAHAVKLAAIASAALVVRF